MTDIDVSRQVSREKIDALQAEILQMPQCQDMVTSHYFNGGMYCRKLWRPAGTVIVGKVHKEPHFFLCAAGEIMAWSETGMRHMMPGDVIESQPGTKRVTLALTDAIGITIHKTDKTDLDEIEADLLEPEPAALFDASNNLKFPELENKACHG
jgi:hypothetical protein